MRVSPGHPNYTYGGRLLAVRSHNVLEVELVVGNDRNVIERNLGLGIRRHAMQLRVHTLLEIPNPNTYLDSLLADQVKSCIPSLCPTGRIVAKVDHGPDGDPIRVNGAHLRAIVWPGESDIALHVQLLNLFRPVR